ncbi:MAG TPA: hypothetical protein VMT80_02130 [Candidatus Paceibacterota bacterium]|nr:hypothetical protein [Candidatus Paceibacterota bacterium]
MSLTFRINSYFAVLIVTIFGAGAALTIIRVAYSDTTAVTYGSGVAKYNELEQSAPLK